MKKKKKKERKKSGYEEYDLGYDKVVSIFQAKRMIFFKLGASKKRITMIIQKEKSSLFVQNYAY